MTPLTNNFSLFKTPESSGHASMPERIAAREALVHEAAAQVRILKSIENGLQNKFVTQQAIERTVEPAYNNPNLVSEQAKSIENAPATQLDAEAIRANIDSAFTAGDEVNV